MGTLPLKKRVNRDQCNFAAKQRMLGVFAIDEPRSPARARYATLPGSLAPGCVFANRKHAQLVVSSGACVAVTILRQKCVID